MTARLFHVGSKTYTVNKPWYHEGNNLHLAGIANLYLRRYFLTKLSFPFSFCLFNIEDINTCLCMMEKKWLWEELLDDWGERHLKVQRDHSNNGLEWVLDILYGHNESNKSSMPLYSAVWLAFLHYTCKLTFAYHVYQIFALFSMFLRWMLNLWRLWCHTYVQSVNHGHWDSRKKIFRDVIAWRKWIDI